MEIQVQDNKTPCRNSAGVAQLLRGILVGEGEIDRDKEHVWVVGLTTRNSVKYLELVSLGTLDGSLMHPREIFRMAILKGVKSIILAHNHPSENLNPSTEDSTMTKQLSEAGRIVGIKLLDHVIVTLDSHFSFADAGML